MDAIKSRKAVRLDTALVNRGMAPSREQASELIREGKVLVNGSVATKAARQVRHSDILLVTSPPRFVSRGGLKLEGALSRFATVVEGRRVLDAGSSTGGFTDCLLQHGAKTVYAVDVGSHQLHEKLRNDPRVVSFENTNVRDFVDPEGLGFDLVVADLSFTSISPVASRLVDLARPSGELIVLIKPQFEVGRKEASRGRGVIRNPVLWRSSLKKAAEDFVSAGATVIGLATSEIRGAQGNVEFFLYIRKGQEAVSGELDRMIDTELALLQSESYPESD